MDDSARAGFNIDTKKNVGEDLVQYIGPWRVNNETVKPCWNKPAQGKFKFKIQLIVYEIYHFLPE